MQDNYILKETVVTKNAVIRVFSPELSDEERARRMKAIQKAAKSMLQRRK